MKLTTGCTTKLNDADREVIRAIVREELDKLTAMETVELYIEPIDTSEILEALYAIRQHLS